VGFDLEHKNIPAPAMLAGCVRVPQPLSDLAQQITKDPYKLRLSDACGGGA